LKAANDSGIVDSDLHYLLAECLLKVDEAGKVPAINELNRAIALNTNSVSARALRGKLLLDFGRPKEALNDLELAHQSDPSSRSAAYNLARAYRTLGKNAEAQQLFGKLRASGPDSLGEMSRRRLNEVLTEYKGNP
jgi:tetratricopeptide (TPR) repeat protein